ncbi:hypothetical protein CcI49_35775 [Frankia sp. CcI49]|nr:hypothetical protein CcI49_35775 [Frankia sp. CcI49]
MGRTRDGLGEPVGEAREIRAVPTAPAGVRPASGGVRRAAGQGSAGQDDAVLWRLQGSAGNRAVGRLLASPNGTSNRRAVAASATLGSLRPLHRAVTVQRSWIGDRVAWVRNAIRAGNWETADPPGAYYVLNGLSLDDMVRLLRGLTSSEREQLANNLEEHGGGSDRPRIHLALVNASAPAASSAFRELSERLLWAIRSENFTTPPDGAFHILGEATSGQLAGLVAALNRDAMDALIDRRDQARNIRGASEAMAAIERRRGRGGPTRSEQHLIDLVEGGAWVRFFTEFNGMQEFDQLRFLRGSQGVVPSIRDNLQAANGIADPVRVRYLLERATTSSAASLYVDAVVQSYSWQPKYRVEHPQDLSRIIRFGNMFEVEIDINKISDEQMSEEAADKQFHEATPGPGGFLWPAVLNRSTLPVLWQAKQRVREQQERILFDDVLRDGILVVQYFLDVVSPVAHGFAIRSLAALRGASLSERWMKGAQVVRGRMPHQPGSGYATSLGELAEGPILRRYYPNARSAPPKFRAYDGVEGGVATETLTTEGPKAKRITVVNQKIKGGRWISIKSILSPNDANPENVRKTVNAALNDMYNEAHNPSLRKPALDPDPVHPDTFYRMYKETPDRVTLHIELPVERTPELESAARAAAKQSTVPAELPDFDLVIKGTSD